MYSGVKQGPDLFPCRNLSESGARIPALGSWVEGLGPGASQAILCRGPVSHHCVQGVVRTERGLEGNPTDSRHQASLFPSPR